MILRHPETRPGLTLKEDGVAQSLRRVRLEPTSVFQGLVPWQERRRGL